MKAKNISMLGAGKMAAILSRYFAAAGHKVYIGAKDQVKAAQLASEIGQGVQGSSLEAAIKNSDIVFLAVPYLQIEETLKLTGPLSGKIVVDMSNPLKADFSGLLIGGNTSAGEELAKSLPQAKVVKAFNCLYATVLERGPDYGDHRAQVFYAGDDEQAKQVVAELIEDTGFQPLNTGPLKSSRYQEQLTALVIQADSCLQEAVQITPVMLMRESVSA